MSKLVEVGVDVSFHHASLVHSDVEWTSIQSISNYAPYIYIGNFQNAICESDLKDNNIKVILAITPFDKDLETKKIYTKMGIIHQFLPLDNVPYPAAGEKTLKDICDDSYNLIAKCVTQKINLLVHCMQGVSAAAAVLAHYSLRFAYLTAQQKSISINNNILPSIIKKLKDCRPCIAINYGFIEQLEDVEELISRRPINLDTSLSTQRNKKLMLYYKSLLETSVRNDLEAMKKGTYSES